MFCPPVFLFVSIFISKLLLVSCSFCLISSLVWIKKKHFLRFESCSSGSSQIQLIWIIIDPIPLLLLFSPHLTLPSTSHVSPSFSKISFLSVYYVSSHPSLCRLLILLPASSVGENRLWSLEWSGRFLLDMCSRIPTDYHKVRTVELSALLFESVQKSIKYL